MANKTSVIDGRLMKRLVDEFEGTPAEGPYVNEGDFEKKFVLKVCKKVLDGSLKLYTHPWRDKAKERDKTKEREWWESKEWGAIHGWGTVQAFDVLARHEASQKSIAVEVKLAQMWNGNLPTGDFQRMLGQCLLARLAHEAVVGVFGHAADLSAQERDDAKKHVKRLAEDFDIWLVMKRVNLRPTRATSPPT